MLTHTGKWPRQHNSPKVQACYEHSLSLKAQLFTSCENCQHCHTRTRHTEAPSQTSSSSSTTSEERNNTNAGTAHVFGSKAKSEYVMHLLLIKYSSWSAEQLLQLSHANVHWLVFLVDWSPKVIPNLSVSSDVRRTWLTERDLWLLRYNHSRYWGLQMPQ